VPNREHWSQRLNRAMAAKGMTPADLVRVTGLGKALIYAYVKGRIDQPREPALNRVANALGVSTAWLMFGGSSQNTTHNLLAIDKIPVLNLALIDGKLGTRGQLADLASGEFVPVGEDVGPRSAAVRVEDEAIAPVLRPGDMVVVDPDAPLVPGKYVLAIVDDVAVIRRYRPMTGKRAGTVELLAEHPDFPPLELNGSGRIIGRITKRISDL